MAALMLDLCEAGVVAESRQQEDQANENWHEAPH
jgi:hypothetical protein